MRVGSHHIKVYIANVKTTTKLKPIENTKWDNTQTTEKCIKRKKNKTNKQKKQE